MDGDKTPWRASAKVTLTLPFPDAFPDVPAKGLQKGEGFHAGDLFLNGDTPA
jgi:hypothetical protein